MEETLEKYALEHINDYADLIKFKSISAQNLELPETANYLAQIFSELGAACVKKLGAKTAPIVFAEFNGNDPTKTILFYHHYDVQPPEPLEKWDSEPFEPTIHEGKLFARGASDNKGELIARLLLVKYFQAHGGLPVNVKFFVEGQEEIGSPQIEEIVTQNKALLKADVCIWEGGGKNNSDNYQIVGGMRGISVFDVEVRTADVDLHSSLASYAENAAWRLIRGLATLRDDQGHVLVEGFYDDIEPLSDQEIKAVKNSDFDLEKAKKRAGLRKTISQDPKFELVNQPTLTINGLDAGYQGSGIKTVIPHLAKAKLDCRLSPSQDPEKIATLIQAHFNKHGFADLKVHYRLGELGFRSEMNDPFVALVLKEATKIYGKDTKYLPNSAGGGPAEIFGKTLKLPILAFGVTYAGSQVHSPNEHIRLADFGQGTQLLGEILTVYGNN